jgi:hypothetical protein
VKGLTADLSRWSWSDQRVVVLMRDLTVPHSPPKARINISIVPLDEDLAEELFDPTGLDPIALREVESRRRLWQVGLPTPYVAVDDSGAPCYVQWVVDGRHADLIHDQLGPIVPNLGPGDLVLEGAWATPRARGKRIMAEAMSNIVEIGAQPHHRRALTCVTVENEPSIRGCRAAGFEVGLVLIENWRLGRKRVCWEAAASA